MGVKRGENQKRGEKDEKSLKKGKGKKIDIGTVPRFIMYMYYCGLPRPALARIVLGGVHSMSEQNPEQGRENDVSLGPLAKDGEKMMASLEAGHMVGILSKSEVMYTFIHRGMYRCFIHPLGAEEGRQKAFPMDTEHRAVIKNLANLADQLFEIRYHEGMHPMGVMVAAEQGIIEFLDMIGELPAEDFDFMATDEPAQ